jgi:hypothetical protein
MDRYRERLNQIGSLVLQRVRSPWISVPLILFVLAYGFLLFSYTQELPKQTDLAEQAHRQARIASSRTTLERLQAAEAKFKAIRNSIPPSTLREIDVFRAMWGLATEVGLDPNNVNIGLSSESPRQKVGNTEYRTLVFTMTATGDPDAVWDLVQRLDRGETSFKTLVLNSTNMVLGSSGKADLNLTIYTRLTGQ